MDQRSFQRLLRRTVALPVVLLVLLAIVLACEILLLSATLRWVDHSDQVISDARQLQRQIVEMETGLRGYHLTGDSAFLDSYNDAKSKVPDQLNLLRTTDGRQSRPNSRLQGTGAVGFGVDTLVGRADAASTRDLAVGPGDLLTGQQMMVEIREKQRSVCQRRRGFASQPLGESQAAECRRGRLGRRTFVADRSLAVPFHPARVAGAVSHV